MTWLYIALGVVVLILLYLFMIFPARVKKEDREKLCGRCYAHRGYYNNEKGLPPENSLEAFDEACKHGYGMELDVQFTKDRKVIVFHDNEYTRMCGLDEPVWEVDWQTAKQLKLAGRDFGVPLFTDVLKTVNGRAPIIVEVKAEGVNVKHYYELCEAVWDILKDYKGDYCVESFHPLVVRWWKKNHPEIVRGQLAFGYKYYAKQKLYLVGFLISQLLSSFATRPHFIAYYHEERHFPIDLVRALGAISAMWTPNTIERGHELMKNNEIIIFEHYESETVYEVKK